MNNFHSFAWRYVLAVAITASAILLTGCEKREKDEPQRYPGSYFNNAPCTTLADGSIRCSDVR